MSNISDAEPLDENWILNEARKYRLSDVSAAKSWLIVGRTLFQRNIDIQFEMYQLEKVNKNVKEAAKQFEEMTLCFGKEMRLWLEISAMSEAIQSDSSDEASSFLREVFNTLPATLQRSMLLSAAESAKDTLHQCRLLLLTVDRYPDQVTEQGVKLVELLLQAEKVAKCSSVINCYRKYLACNVLPMLLRGGVSVSSQKLFFHWLEKAIEFYLCYIGQLNSSADLAARNSNSIAGLTDKESNIPDPWNQLYLLIQMVSSQLQWKYGRTLSGDNKDLQWQQLNNLYENLSMKSKTVADVGNGQREQLFFLSIVCFFRALHGYSGVTEPTAGNALTNTDSSVLILVEIFTAELGDSSYLEHKSKKIKTDQDMPSISVSNGSTSSDVVTNFTAAFQYWRLLRSDLLKNDFTRLLQHWSTDCWTALNKFETDACICQGSLQDALARLQNVSATSSNQLRTNLQLACCYFGLENYVKSCQLIFDVISGLAASPEPPSAGSSAITKCGKTSGRHLQFLSCSDVEVMSYCINLLISCLKERSRRVNVDDMLLGHMIVLSQYDWPKYESLFCDIIRTIKKRGQFAYNLFFSYVVDIDVLEEFAFIWTTEGGRVNLDIMSNSAKGTAFARTVTRGVNKVVKEDLKMAMERQVLRCNENVSILIRTFLTEEADLLKMNLST